ncbi:hypothetical protein CKQ70_30765 [Bacillus toyonensis]|nr:hypothetical protein CKQ70_30765 [Bacillus toyonensis]
MELNFNPTLDENGEDIKKLQRIKEAERKKALKEYQPTDNEIWFTGYELILESIKLVSFKQRSVARLRNRNSWLCMMQYSKANCQKASMI